MKGDFSRSSFDPGKHFSGVRMQQGRVQLDADWNENLDILRHRIETETIDVIGQCGVPVHDPGFGVVSALADLSPVEQAWLAAQGIPALLTADFYLTQGRAYVDGLLLENDHSLPFSQQPFVLPKGQALPSAAGAYLLYLDVWERHISAIEDPSIREVALGGPDTATRSQVIWQAVLANVGAPGATVTCSDNLTPWPAGSSGTLAARTVPVADPTDPCAVPLGAGYKRLENQLYRVEIHKGSGMAGGPTYKWSRDNGSVVVAVTGFSIDGDNTKIGVASLGRDDVLGVHKFDWVEVLDDATELAGQPGALVQILNIDSNNVLELSAAVTGFDINGHPKVRRWDSDGNGGNGLALLSSFVAVEGGIQVEFDTTGTFRTGDYWLIPARTVPGQFGDIQWPQDSGGNPLALLPFGITHHYCRLAILSIAPDSSGVLATTLVEDCRKKFPPLTELPTGGDNCCSVTVGQGGDYPDLPTALAARPIDADWWTICVLPGVLSLADTLTIDSAASLTLRGCGVQSRLVAPAGKPAFIFTNGTDLTLDGLRLDASCTDPAVQFSQCMNITVVNCSLLNTIAADAVFGKGLTQGFGPALAVDTGRQVEIRENLLVGLPAVQANVRNMDLLHNTLMGGGIQIVPPSAYVQIEDNLISGGKGPGIQLGGGAKTAADYVGLYYTVDRPVETVAKKAATRKARADATKAYSYSSDFAPKTGSYLAAIRLVTISRNLIGRMAGSGIVTETDLTNAAALGDVDELLISENQIILCAMAPDVTLSAASQVCGGIAAIGLFGTRIVDNFIADNGRAGQAACGIFILDGSDIQIEGNVIVENGTSLDSTKPAFYQAGIAAQYVFGNFLTGGATGNAAGLTGYPAVRIQGNQVVCPAGQALTVTAVGGVVIDGNTLSTRERLSQPTDPLDFGVQGACVYVADAGLPIWNPNLALQLQMLSNNNTALHLSDVQTVGALESGLPDGRILFHSNQVSFNTGVVENVVTLGEIDSGFAQRAWKAATFSALFISLDDISVNDNQFQATVPPYIELLVKLYATGKMTVGLLFAYLFKFMQVGTLAPVIRADGNGLNEKLFSNYISYASTAAVMNVVTSNTATHFFLATGPKTANANNLTLF
jgi:hypothetical protein